MSLLGPFVRNITNTALNRQPSSYLCLLKQLRDTPPNQKISPKISVVGAGQVGISICAFLIQRNLARHLVIHDIRYDWAKAEALDLLHASCWLKNPHIEACGDGSHTKDSDIVIVTAGARPVGKDRSRLLVMKKTVEILKLAMPKLIELSPKAVFVIVSNPADVMTYAIQRICKLEKHRCFTTGCSLDSARFRFLIAQRLKVPTTEVEGYVIGEHGNSAVPVWSSVTVGGVPLVKVVRDLGTSMDTENWNNLFKDVTQAGASVGNIKGYTNWAIALSAVNVVEAMLENSGRILCLGTDMQGMNSIGQQVVLSLPCKVTSTGISHVLQLPLTALEQEKLHKSAEVLMKAQCSLEL
ncbi:uncharacterized protein Dwil_GK15970 [Drosophila willistoni]|uniref:L-lactate dehydrogenase n=2 Tax=Drosophila willistoni TaxID=7260 RepID=B4MS98_DROWI|nr:uncharacterized protein Dwil_GK15970 [Drosophila willistoni]